jgi:hypothetical protein
MLFHLTSLLRGSRLIDPYIEQIPLSVVEFRTDHPVDLILDGDHIPASSTVNIRLGPSIQLVID